jgi:hypothetical protein
VAIAVLALLSLALPLFVLVVGASISDPDPERLARLHLESGLWIRAVLTFVYFPAVLLLHFLVQPARAGLRTLYLAGFLLFLAGNGIDLAYRAVQFLTVHGVWAPQLLAGSDAARAKIVMFGEIAPAISASFSLMFGVGRCAMGWALVRAGGGLAAAAGLALIAYGLCNLAVLAKLAIPAPVTLLVWAAGLVLVALVAWQGEKE